MRQWYSVFEYLVQYRCVDREIIVIFATYNEFFYHYECQTTYSQHVEEWQWHVIGQTVLLVTHRHHGINHTHLWNSCRY